MSKDCPNTEASARGFVRSVVVAQYFVAKRRSSWACIGNLKPKQETIEGTYAQETSAYQRIPTTQYAAQGSNPPIGALYMQLAKITHTHIKPHRVPPVQQALSSTAPTAGATGTIPAHTQLRTRRRGNSRPKTRLDTEALARETWPGLNTEYRLVDANART